MNALIVGGSSGLGRELAEAFARRGSNLILVASDRRDLEAVAADLSLRYGVQCDTLAVDMGGHSAYAQELANLASKRSTPLHVLFPVGYADSADLAGAPVDLLERVVRINFTGIASIISALIERVDLRGGSIVGFGSIAQIRGRAANIAYAAAKRGLGSYFESLRHAFAQQETTVQYYVVGYLDTPQSSGRRGKIPPADPRRFADFIIHRLGRDFGTAHYPRYWALLAAILRHLPWFIYRNLKF